MNKQKNSFFRKNTVNMLLSCLFIVLLSACFSGWKSDEGTIIINLGGEGRAVWPPSSAMLSQMDYTVTLSGNGEVIKRTSKGGGAIRTTVAVGYWNVQVDASYEKKSYAEGSAFVEVKAGQNNQVSIQMSQVIKFYKEFYSANEIEWNTAITEIANEESGTDLNYAINVTEDFKLPGTTENTFGKVKGINIYIRGNQKITLASQGSIIRIAAEQSVTLQDVGFVGLTNNNTALVYVTGPDASFTMTGNASLTDNTSNNAGGGLRVEESAFTMNGGTISGNASANSGVFIRGTFTMNDGTISGNSDSGVFITGTFIMNGGTISGNSNKTGSAQGGGVYINSGTFTMNGGTISDNTAESSSNYESFGGGIYIRNDITFTMNGGTISGNISSKGGGVFNGGTFNMNGGTISGNTAHSRSSAGSGGGGGVFSNGTFTMTSGVISGNISNGNGHGGGVYTDSMFFSMKGGTISGNTADSYGGGLYSRSINMTGGTISGNKATNGGGASVISSFLISGGTVYGNDAGTALSNTASEAASADTPTGAALYRVNSTTKAEYGTFADPDDSASAWTGNGMLVTTDKTIRVVNGVLQE